MAVKILIKRKVNEQTADGLDYLLKKMRSQTLNQAGYISGETYKRFDEEGENLVISTWQSVDDWRRWFNSEERKDIQNQIDILLEEPTEYEIYIPA
ncbi:antibiotic biosynthesis monooxygenase family protein [Propionivibrio sp.]|jgi:heme-degrading monooxygenase HmoA|uniref:antibiotic biosynthesis monooxygenase family protein n=1 Tax=Propionivibrio sp. TaxID=2212460 RepID=UPI00272E88F3|nr:antibiotic biosynthesis monooxygenase family protein [Propionivibrio sp.]